MVNTVHSLYLSAITTRSVCSTQIFILRRNTTDGKWMAIKLVRSFPRKQNVSEFKILVLHLRCVLCVLVAGRRLFMSAECHRNIPIFLPKRKSMKQNNVDLEMLYNFGSFRGRNMKYESAFWSYLSHRTTSTLTAVHQMNEKLLF